MKKTLVCVLGGIFAFFFAINIGLAQPIQKGSMAIGVQGSLARTTVEDSDTDSLIIGLNFSNYFTKKLELGGVIFGSLFSYEDEDMTMLFFDIIFNYNFTGESNIVPYAGAALGGLLIETDDYDDFFGTAGAQAGIKSFLNKNVFISTELRYRHVFIDEEDSDSLDQYSLNVGLNFVF